MAKMILFLKLFACTLVFILKITLLKFAIMTFQKFSKQLQFQLRMDAPFKSRLEQLATKNKMNASEYLRKLVNDDYANISKK